MSQRHTDRAFQLELRPKAGTASVIKQRGAGLQTRE